MATRIKHIWWLPYPQNARNAVSIRVQFFDKALINAKLRTMIHFQRINGLTYRLKLLLCELKN
jgi:hypothetical protein